MINKVVTVFGIAFALDVTYLLIKNLHNRFSTRFTLLMFGEKFTCDSKKCKDCWCSHHNVERIASYIQGARSSIDLCMYMLSNKQLCTQILKAHNKGVQVRIIVDVTNGLNLNVRALQRAGIFVSWPDPSKSHLMHHKFCVIDGNSKSDKTLFNKLLDRVLPPTKQSNVMTGSLNWTQSAVEGNYENVFITNDPIIVRQYQRIFDSISEEFS